MLVTRGTFPHWMRPENMRTLMGSYDQLDNLVPPSAERYFHVEKTDNPFEVGMGYILPGPARQRTEGGRSNFDTLRPGRVMAYLFPAWELAIGITKEAQADDKKNRLVPLIQRAIHRSMIEAKEESAAGMFNDAFTYVGWESDGVSLANAAHPLIQPFGSTWSNAHPTGAALSQTSLDAAVLSLRTLRNDSGILMAEMEPVFIDCHPLIAQDAERLIGTERSLGNNWNDTNPYFKKMQVRWNARFAYQGRWSVRATNHSWMWFDRVDTEYDAYTDDAGRTLVQRVYARWGRGCDDPRGTYFSDAP